MSTLDILRRLWIYANSPRHPIVRFEVRRAPIWNVYTRPLRRFYRYAVRFALGVLGIATLMEVLFRSRISFMLLIVMLLVPMLGVVLLGGILLGMVGWQIPISLAGSAAIVNERASRTWDILLTIPMAHGDLLLAKLAVGLTRFQSFITAAVLLQVVPLISALGQASKTASGAPLLITLLLIGLFFIDRLQQFALAGLLGLVASLLAETWPIASTGAVALGAVLWLIHGAFVVALTVLLNPQAFDVTQVFIIGLPSLIGVARSPWLGIGVLVGALLAQEWLVRRTFAWLLWRMVTIR